MDAVTAAVGQWGTSAAADTYERNMKAPVHFWRKA
jgi:hypothetical protein